MTTSLPSLDDQRDLISWLDEREARYEVLDGVVLVSPPDRFAHADRVFGVAPREDCGDDGIRVAPLLVVEVLSRSTRRRDRGEKRELYAEFGVPHYWLVDPDRHAATVLHLAGEAYDEVLTAVGELVVEAPFPVRVPL